MSQNLSFSSIAATLAVLSVSATGLVGCASATTPPAETPADAKEVPAATTSAATAAADPGPMKDGVAPMEGASGTTPTPTSEAPKAATDPATAPAAASTAPAAATKDDKSKAAPKKKAAGAKAGCGAGTCG